MFLKKYKVKSSTTIKGSERKKLRNVIEQHYLGLSPEDLNQLVSNKSDLSQSKILVHNGAIVTVYFNGNNPIFFSVENRIFPTLYTLWKFPNLIPTIATVPPVLEKIRNGADLMAPGIVVDDVTVEEFRNLKTGDICSVRVKGNRAPIAVGLALMHSDEILMDGCRGKAVSVHHFYKDHLWESGEQMSLPEIAELVSVAEDDIDNQDQLNENIIESCDTAPVNEMSTLQMNDEESECDALEPSSDKEDALELSMDDILKQCFMFTLKVDGKKIPLPILSSNFYRTYMLNHCPTNLNFDIKKTTYKKLSVFLKSMSSDGLIEVKELTKGVESIVSMKLDHEAVLSFIPHFMFKEHLKQQKKENLNVVESQMQDKYKFPEIVEMFVVSAQVQRIFANAKYKKGEALTINKIREVLRDYVKANSLQDENNPRRVNLDPVLTSCLLKGSDPSTSKTWEELYEVTLSRMSPAFTITFEGEPPKLKKGLVDPIDISIATRSGNKKVTLIHNLENFGINPEKLASQAQVAVAASTSVGVSPNGKGTQVLIQGNQLRYLQMLFSDVYKVPKKYIRGLENLSSKKK